MELLLDTCTLLYACFDDQRLPKNIKEMIADSDNDIFVSMASLWEIAIKNAKRPESMPYSAEEICDALSNADYSILPIHYSHFFLLKDIIHEQIHQDPFDHLLIAIAKSKDFHIVTCDEFIQKYNGIKVIAY